MVVNPDVAKYGLDPWGLIYIPVPFMVLATIALFLRVWVRISFSRTFWWDDWLLIGSYILFLLECCCLIAVGEVQLRDGIAGPIMTLGVLNFVGVAAYIIGQILFKTSMAIFFLRIVIKRWQRWLIIVSVAIFNIYSIGVLFLFVFQCGDPGTINILQPNCIDFNTITGPIIYVLATLNAVIDWIFALIPISVVRKLQMKRQDKKAVIFIILLACSGSAASIVRIPFVDGLNLNASYYSQQSNRIAYASAAEGGIGIVVASMATYRPLMKLLKEKMRTVLSCGSEQEKVSEPTRTVSARPNVHTCNIATCDTCHYQESESYAQSWNASHTPKYAGSTRGLIIPDIEMDDFVPPKHDMKSMNESVVQLDATELDATEGYCPASSSVKPSHGQT